VIHQAITAAYGGRGVAHLTLPQDVISAKAHGEVSSIATLKPRSETAANESDVDEIARLVDKATSMVIMCGAGCHGAADELRDLSDRLKAPLNSLGEGQGHYAVRRSALDGGHRHDRHQSQCTMQ